MEGFIVKLDKVEVHECVKCPKVFTNTGDLKTHNARHEFKEELFRARVLEHIISAKVLLKRVQIYQCKECPRCFLHYEPLNEHQKEHSRLGKSNPEDNKNELKPYKCEECGWRFVEISTLNTHLKVHEPFPHVCHCGIGFYQIKDLATHEKLVHPTLQPKTVLAELNTKSDFIVKPKKRTKTKGKEKPRLPAKLAFPKQKFKSKSKTKAKSKAKSTLNNCNKENNKFSKNKDGDYVCSFCGQTYKDETQFFAHVNTHTSEFPHVCDECPYGCKTQAMLIVHKKEHNGGYDRKWKCNFCSKVLRDRASLILHLLVHTTERPHECTICPKKFTQNHTLKNHLNWHAGIYPFKCEHCGKRFVYKGALDLHERTHTGYKPYNCKFCGKEFSDPSAFKRHNRIHTGEKPHVCRYCPKAFSDNSAWLVHMRRHEGYSHTCKICSKELSCLSSLRAHVIQFHDNKTYECDYCGVIKNRKQYLRNHILMVHLKKRHRYQCKYCPKMFHFQCQRNKHERLHEGNEYYACPICCQYCGSEASLKKHIAQNHSNIEDSFKCEHCKARFSNIDSLKSHVTLCHSRSFCKRCKKNLDPSLKHHICVSCSICGRYFKTDSDMRIHYKSHLKQTRYKKNHGCSECAAKFYEATALERHGLERHGTTFCDHCGENFNGKRKLRNHIWSRHMLSLYCNVCMKRFYNEHEFRDHKGIGCVKKVECRFCNKLFFKSDLQGHVMTRHGRHVIFRHKCDMCGSRFIYKRKLIRHFRMFHRVIAA